MIINMIVNADEVKTLRELAIRIKHYASLDIQEERKKLWLLSNSLSPKRAMVVANPQNGWVELVPEETLVCKDEFLKYIELDMRRTLFRCEHIPDDVPIEASVMVPLIISKSNYGFDNLLTNPTFKRGAYHIEPAIKCYDDLKKLHPAEITIDRETTNQRYQCIQELIGDILEVRIQGVDFCRCGLTRVLVHLRGLSQLMYDMYDNPKMLHELMAFLRDEQLREFEMYEKEKILEYNTTSYSWLGSGGLCATNELKLDKNIPATMSQMMVWGESQETVGVGPEQFEEFVLNYQLPILNKFGLVDYGCCEELDQKLDLLIKKIPKLRWVAVSPWANRNIAAEKLGKKYVYVYKPMPTAITCECADFEFAERQLRETMHIARNNTVHIVMKDTSTFHNEPHRIEQWTKMAQRVAEEMA